jgi:hypothetical protein
MLAPCSCSNATMVASLTSSAFASVKTARTLPFDVAKSHLGYSTFGPFATTFLTYAIQPFAIVEDFMYCLGNYCSGVS